MSADDATIPHKRAPLPPTTQSDEPRAEQPRDASRLDAADGIPVEIPGRYEIRDRTGKGGQAVVLVAFDRSLGREVALKILALDDGPASDDSLAETTGKRSIPPSQRFLREARVTGQLDHPNIVPVHEVGRRADGTLYYTMRLVRGRTLSAALADCRSLADRLKLLKPFLDLCNAIAFAHSRGVIHRDIKPANVMVGEFGETVLLDWGIAKVKGARDIGEKELRSQLQLLRQPGEDETQAELIGTPSYMSPEQAAGEVQAIDDRSDTWALGVVLYELLAGRKPFKGAHDADTLVRIATDHPPPVLELCPEAPRELAAVAMKALRRRKEERYQSARELAEEVSAFMTGGRVGAYEYSSMELLRRFAEKNRPAIAAAAVALAAVLAALVGVTLALRSESRARIEAQAARAREHDERLVANLHLAQALHDKSEHVEGDARHLESRLWAAASLRSNPAHPRSPFYSEPFAREHPEAQELRVRAASRLYRSQLAWEERLDKRLRERDALRGVDVAPDGSIAAAVADGRVALWAPDGKTRSFSGLAGRAYSVRFSRDGRFIAAAGKDPRALVFDVATGALVRELGGHGDAVVAVACSPDGTRWATASWDGAVRLWGDGPTPLLAKPGDVKLHALAFSPDGTQLASAAEDGRVRVWDASLKLLRTIDAHAGEAYAVSWSGDGRQLLSGGDDKVVKMWDAATGASVRHFLGHTDGVRAVVPSPDGRLLASAGYDRTVRLWEREGRLLTTVGGHEDFVMALAFDGPHRLVTSGYDKSVRVFTLKEGRSALSLVGHDAAVYAVGVSPDGARLATGGWDRTVRLWDAKTGAPLAKCEGHQGVIDAVSFSPDGRHVVSASRDRSVRVWDAASGDAVGELAGHRDLVYDADYTADGARIVTGGSEGLVRVFDAATLKLLHEVPTGSAINQLALSPDGKVLAATGYDHSTKLVDTATWAVRGSLGGHSDWVSGVDFSPDGRLLVTSGKDARVLLWDVAGGRQLAEIPGHRQWVNVAHFSPDGRLLVTASDDMTVRVVDVASRATKMILVAHSEVAGIAFARDSSWLAMPDGQTVRLLPLDFSALEADAVAALAEAERATGQRLAGFELRVAAE